MSALATIYAILFFLFCTWSVLSDFQDHKPIEGVVAEAIAISLLSTGNCFWLIGFKPTTLTSIWYVAIVSAVIIEVYAVLRDRTQYIESELANDEDPSELHTLVSVADVGTILLFLPAIIMNVLFASSG